MSDETTKNVPDENAPTPEALAEMPEINESRFRRRPGRGHHAAREASELEPSNAKRD